jgi:hypothetical protein
MAAGDVHTYFEDGLWKNRVEGGTRASNTALRHLDAVLSGRAMARKRRVVHVVHSPEGQVEEERDYRSGRPLSVGRRDAAGYGAPPAPRGPDLRR